MAFDVNKMNWSVITHYPTPSSFKYDVNALLLNSLVLTNNPFPLAKTKTTPQKTKSNLKIKPKSMATSFYSRLFLVICATVLLMMITSPPTVEAGGLDLGMEWIHQTKTATCEGSIADCMLQQGEEEFQLDNEINRRILANTKYISYGALQRNTVPCSRRGASYYNCKPGAQANPYSRGCSAITRCRS
ncbi:unnamed protein product [Trifolium pratense]|uniref:Uncharacterized protein n=1 Tax=Trifolium pratense TaxID=57577 RepID=A0ACB0IHP7_TRIPR|nr:unnamed protein product [Trifolium pratense]